LTHDSPYLHPAELTPINLANPLPLADRLASAVVNNDLNAVWEYLCAQPLPDTYPVHTPSAFMQTVDLAQYAAAQAWFTTLTDVPLELAMPDVAGLCAVYWAEPASFVGRLGQWGAAVQAWVQQQRARATADAGEPAEVAKARLARNAERMRQYRRGAGGLVEHQEVRDASAHLRLLREQRNKDLLHLKGCVSAAHKQMLEASAELRKRKADWKWKVQQQEQLCRDLAAQHASKNPVADATGVAAVVGAEGGALPANAPTNVDTPDTQEPDTPDLAQPE
jgi:hypothetical protein